MSKQRSDDISGALADGHDGDDSILAEAAAALAETEAVLKTRKDALVARHVEGRESMQGLDHVFRADQQRPDDGLGFENYLDKYRRELEEREKEQKLVDE